MRTKDFNPKKVSVITLGCSKNLVDSEEMITQLRGNQFDVSHDERDEDTGIVIVNTCGFIDLAKEQSINTILDYAAMKTKGEIEKLYVTGCLSQRYKDNLEEEIPEVDAFFGTLELPGLLQRLQADFKHELVGERHITTLQHFAYLKIAEGCNRTCSFCAIPLMRGKHISKPIELIVKEASNFAIAGVKELILISQELTYYGLDLYKKRALGELLTHLNKIEGIEWIRLQYLYPSKFPYDLLETIPKLSKVCKYIDIPLQHASDAMLHSMKRQIDLNLTRQLITDIREAIPGVAVRTTFIVGFPGETASDFEQLVDFVKEMRFDRIGVFKYSHEEDTDAFLLVDDVSEEQKNERANYLMEIQQEISLAHNQNRIGTIMRVLIDRRESGCWYGRTEFDSPEVDNEVIIEADEKSCQPGKFYHVEIIDALEYDLIGKLVEN